MSNLLAYPVFIVFLSYIGIYVMIFLDKYVFTHKKAMESEELMSRYMALHRMKTGQSLKCDFELKYVCSRFIERCKYNVEEFKKSWSEL